MSKKELRELMRCARCKKIAHKICGGTYWNKYTGICTKCYRVWSERDDIMRAIRELRAAGITLVSK